jgi:hypothetical protein
VRLQRGCIKLAVNSVSLWRQYLPSRCWCPSTKLHGVKPENPRAFILRCENLRPANSPILFSSDMRSNGNFQPADNSKAICFRIDLDNDFCLISTSLLSSSEQHQNLAGTVYPLFRYCNSDSIKLHAIRRSYRMSESMITFTSIGIYDGG